MIIQHHASIIFTALWFLCAFSTCTNSLRHLAVQHTVKVDSLESMGRVLSQPNFGSMVLMEGECIDADNLSFLLSNTDNFDISYTISSEQSLSHNYPAHKLIPATFSSEQQCLMQPIIEDMNDLIVMISQSAERARHPQKVACRLALMNGVRCPKWHEDYVNLRLLKSYYGRGTDWIDPSDAAARLQFAAMAALDREFAVSSTRSSVRHAACGDVLVIAGKRREEEAAGVLPVIHRSPQTDPETKRLLFTVTLSRRSI